MYGTETRNKENLKQKPSSSEETVRAIVRVKTVKRSETTGGRFAVKRHKIYLQLPNIDVYTSLYWVYTFYTIVQ